MRMCDKLCISSLDVAAVARIALVALAVALAWTFVNRIAERDRADDHRVFDQRLYDLTSRVLEGNSVLGCLEPDLSDAVDSSCEKELFASPQRVGAAMAVVAARWSLLVDSLEHAGSKDPGYETRLDELRRVLQADRYGFLAQVLSAREGCTINKCDALDKLTDASHVRANLSERTFEDLVARNAAAWATHAGEATPMVAAPPRASPARATGIIFPSAASIPPVSIMNNEPEAATAPAPAQLRPPSPDRDKKLSH